jgi:adenine phosphoribosyltransferase
MNVTNLADLVRNVPDFPVPGIQFKDITTLIGNGAAFQQVIEMLATRYSERPLDLIVGVESRGFIFSAPLAYKLGVGLVPVRKPGKLPADTHQVEYDLEYGTNTLEIHRDAIPAGSRVLIVDDLLATGGTIVAASQLVEHVGGVIEELAFLIELTFLNGRERLQKYAIHSLIQF